MIRQMMGQLRENTQNVNENNRTLETMVPEETTAKSRATVEYYGMRAMAVENGVDHRINILGQIHQGCSAAAATERRLILEDRHAERRRVQEDFGQPHAKTDVAAIARRSGVVDV